MSIANLWGAAIFVGAAVFGAQDASATFSVPRAHANPASVTAGQAVKLTATVKSSAARSRLTIDLEVQDGSGNVIGHKYLFGQSFTAGQKRFYAYNFTVPSGTSAGAYYLHVGVFTAKWATMLAWFGAVANFSVTDPPAPTPTASSTPTPTVANIGCSTTDGTVVTDVNSCLYNSYGNWYFSSSGDSGGNYVLLNNQLTGETAVQIKLSGGNIYALNAQGQTSVYSNGTWLPVSSSSSSPTPTPTPTPSSSQNMSYGPSMTIQPGREFLADSYVYNVLPDNAPLDPNSAKYVSALVSQIQNNYGVASVNTTQYTPPIYFATPDIPTEQFLAIRADDPTFPSWGAGPLSAVLSAVPVPANFQPASGTDEEAVIYDPTSGEYWETWVTQLTGSTTMNSAGQTVPQWQAAWGGDMKSISTNPGYFVTDANGYSWGTTATGIPFLAGMMTVQEQRNGVVDHVVGLAIPETAASGFVFPAQRSDGWSTSSVAIPEGTMFRLPANLNLDAMTMDPYARMIAKAVQRHGLVIWDTAGAVTFRAENPGTNYSVDPYNGPGGIFNCPAGTDPNNPPSSCWPDGNGRLSGFPWDKLQVILPPAK